MEAKQYRRWAQGNLRDRAKERGIQVTGPKNYPSLLLRKCDDLLISYYDKWWRSEFKRSGFGGALSFAIENDDVAKPAIAPLINLGDFFIPIRSPENLEEIDLFIDQLSQLAEWCATERCDQFTKLARGPEPALSKLGPAVKILREFLLTRPHLSPH